MIDALRPSLLTASAEESLRSRERRRRETKGLGVVSGGDAERRGSEPWDCCDKGKARDTPDERREKWVVTAVDPGDILLGLSSSDTRRLLFFFWYGMKSSSSTWDGGGLLRG